MMRALGWLGIALLWLPVGAGFYFEGTDGLRMLTSRQWSLLASTLGYSVLTGAICCTAGFLIAFWTSLLQPFLRRLFLVLYVGTAALPSIVVATPALILFLRVLPNYSQGIVPAAIVQVLCFTPLCALIAMLSVSALPKDLLEAASLVFTPAKALVRVILPLLRPGIAAAFGVASLLSAIDFTVTSIFNWNTYSLEAFTDISAGHPVMAACAPLLVLGVIGASICGKWMSRLVWTDSSLCLRPLPIPKVLLYASAAATIVFAAIVSGMFVGLIGTVDSVSSVKSSLAAASNDFASSLKINLACSAVTLAWALAIVPLLLRTRSWVPWALAIAPFSFLPTMVGIVFAQLGVHVGLKGVWLPAIALAARTVPICAALLAVWLGQIDRSVIEVSRVSLAPVKRISKVYLPLALPALATAVCLIFISGMGEVGTMLLVVQPGQSTLSLRLYNYLHYGSAPDSTAISLLMILTAMLIALTITTRRRSA